jgi:hypothetical protein
MTTYDNEHIPGNTNNYERVTEDVLYCTVLLLQQYGLYLLTRNVEF